MLNGLRIPFDLVPTIQCRFVTVSEFVGDEERRQGAGAPDEPQHVHPRDAVALVLRRLHAAGEDHVGVAVRYPAEGNAPHTSQDETHQGGCKLSSKSKKVTPE